MYGIRRRGKGIVVGLRFTLTYKPSEGWYSGSQTQEVTNNTLLMCLAGNVVYFQGTVARWSLLVFHLSNYCRS